MQNDPFHIAHSSGDLWEGVDFSIGGIFKTTIFQKTHPGHWLAVNLGGPHYACVKNKGRWKKYLYDAGAIGLVPHGEMNECKAYKDVNCITVSLHLPFLEKLLEGEKISLLQQRAVSDPTVYQLSMALKHELLDPHFVGKVYAESLIQTMLLHLVNVYSEKQFAIAVPKGKLTAVQLRNVIEYCYATREANPGLSDLAAQAHLSPFHFSRLFKQTVGVSPCQYLHRLKMDEAKRLIRGQRISLTEIAYQLGFSDQAHFCNAFRKATGVAPGHFQ